jgi:hypothetical protein
MDAQAVVPAVAGDVRLETIPVGGPGEGRLRTVGRPLPTPLVAPADAARQDRIIPENSQLRLGVAVDRAGR